MCPKCGSSLVLLSDEDQEGIWAQCQVCGYKWHRK